MPESLSRPALFSYAFFQNGFIFSALLLGLACLVHLVVCKSTSCKNWHVMFSLILTGMVHLLYCAYMLDYFRHGNSNNDLYPHNSSNECLDFTFPSELANTLTLALLSHCVIQRNFRIPYVAWLLDLVCGGLIITGLFKRMQDSEDQDLVRRQDQESFMIIGSSDASSTGVYWSICEKIVSTEKFNFVVEYGCLYVPVFLVIMCAILKSGECGKNSQTSRLKILKRKCVTDSGDPCLCTELNKAMKALLVYIFILLLVARPAMIIYGYLTSGSFRDVYPGLTNSVVYCFLCGEYCLAVIKNIKITHIIPPFEQKVSDIEYECKASEKLIPLQI